MVLSKLATTIRLSSILILCLGAASAHAKTIEVKLYKMKFIPESISIEKGDTVRWVNKEKRQYHSVWFEEIGDPEPDYFFPEEFFEKTFSDTGVFSYRCGPHPKMLGSVVVHANGNEKNTESNTASIGEKSTQKRQQELHYLVKQDCGSCHGMLLTGGLGPAIRPENLERFTVEDISAVILNGRTGTAMPPWKEILSKSDSLWIAKNLKEGVFTDNEK